LAAPDILESEILASPRMRKTPPAPEIDLLQIPLPDLEDAGTRESLHAYSAAGREEAFRTADSNYSLLLGAMWLRDQGMLDRSVELCRESVAGSIKTADLVGAARGWMAEISVLALRGDFGGASELVSQLEVLSVDAPTLCQSYFHESAASSKLRTVVQDQFDQAVEHFETARTGYQSESNVTGMIRCEIGLASAISGYGLYLDALEHADAGLGLCAEAGDWRYVNRLLLEAALALRDQGYRRNVDELFALSIAWSDFTGDIPTKIRAMSGRAFLHDFEADVNNPHHFKEAELEFLQAINAAESIGALPMAMQTRVDLVHLYQKFGQDEAINLQRSIAVQEAGRMSLSAAPRWFDDHADYKQRLDNLRSDRAFERLREAIEGIANPFFIFDTIPSASDKCEELLNEFRNSAADSLLGLNPIAVRTLSDLTSSPYLRDLREPLLQATNDRVEFFDTIQAEGQWYERRIVPAGDGAVLTLSNVTNSHDAQEALAHAANSAREADRIKSEFLANMSHEVRTPINGVLGLAGLLADSDLNPEQRTYVQGIIASGDILLRVIGDVLDLSKIEADSMAVILQPTQPQKLVSEVVTLYKGQAVKKGIDLRGMAELDVPGSVLLDGPRVQQILGNLVGNAVKFTQTGSVDVTLRSAGDWLELEVKDTGPGIPTDRLEIVFEPFRQLSGRDPRGTGTGLGLTISKRLAELMGGNIRLCSKVGVGTQFIVQLPLVSANASNAPKAVAEAPPSFAGARILLVEDNPVNTLVARGLLAKFGCEVDDVEDGGQAIELTFSEHYDAILMDMRLPTMSGVDATQRIRERERDQQTRRVPIIALTASTLAEERRSCFDAGMDDYVAKPFSEEELRATLAKWIKRESAA
jgi:signal transduction histidine kinase/ActR/RegA family two-component response regulator